MNLGIFRGGCLWVKSPTVSLDTSWQSHKHLSHQIAHYFQSGTLILIFIFFFFFFLLPSSFFWVFILVVFSTSSFPMPGPSGVLSLLCFRCWGAQNWKLLFSRADLKVTCNLKPFNHHFWILMLVYKGRSNIEHWAVFNTFNTIIEVFFFLKAWTLLFMLVFYCVYFSYSFYPLPRLSFHFLRCFPPNWCFFLFSFLSPFCFWLVGNI